MASPTIVITAFNRTESLRRLLKSIEHAVYPPSQEIFLHISIDRGGDPEVLKVAESFPWRHGAKKVFHQPVHLGLVEHILAVGDLTAEYGPIIFLEDDLAVSPTYYQYAAQAVDFYRSEEKIAGISLYNLWFNGYTHFPFTPLHDGSDVFFLQIPFYLGQVLLPRDWTRFREWMQSGIFRPIEGDLLHKMFLAFDEDDWFPIRTKYLVENNLYYVFPRTSLATGFGDAGTHFEKATRFFQAPLLGGQREFQFIPFDESTSVYDSYYEILPDRLNRLTSVFRDYSGEYEINLNATKLASNLHREYVLTTQRCKSPIMTFGLQVIPLEANVIEMIRGVEISFCRKNDLRLDWLSKQITDKKIYDYHNRDRKIKRGFLLFYLLVGLIKKIYPIR